MLTLSHCSVQFGGNYLFDDITFTIGTRDRIGLVGKNGAGKSTMLKILSGNVASDEGNVIKSNDYTIGFLTQDLQATLGKTVLEEAMTSFDVLLEIEKEIDHLNNELMIRTDYESDEYANILDRHAHLHERFNFLGGASVEGTVQRILIGLGFEEKDLYRLVDEFSGGWQMRVELAKILLKNPDCLLLDEPTNHLDIESVQWLELFLKNYEGALVLISHDKAFLDIATNRTIEITNGGIEDYNCSYSKYLVERIQRRDLVKQAYTNQQKEIAKTEEFIERFRSKANLASRVQSRIKMLDKIDRIELEEEDNSAINFRFPPAPRSGLMVIESTDLQKSYGSKHVLKGIDFSIERGRKMAFVGKNGEGKTTCAKILAGVEPYEGTVTIGHNVAIGYFAQQQAETLDGNRTVFETVDDVATGEMRTKIRALLGAFLFSGDDVYKKVKVLSGGEKSRLAMAILLLQPSNLLILDEPTNHLDMRSKDVLKKAIKNYEGTLIVVSHDREFLEGLTDQVAEFKLGKVRVYEGDIYEYLRQRNIEQLADLDIVKQQKKAIKTPIVSHEREELKKNDQEKRKKEKRIHELESLINNLEIEQKSLEEQMSDPTLYSMPDLMKSIHQNYNNIKLSLEKALTEWTSLSD
ncbi:MAG: ABC-F family ATP-binding cassette domain-containing protein [Bacteroidota bacterium]|jgi:ATP-binding cassette subfamily F protein 3